MSKVIQCTTSLQTFEDHESYINEVALFPDRQRMVTGSWDKTLRLWDLKTGVVLKKMEGHRSEVQTLTVSRDGQIIASGDWEGEIIVWHEEIAIQTIKAHTNRVSSVDFSPDGTVLATGSYDRTTKLWCTRSWGLQETPIECNSWVRCVRYSPSGTLLAIATDRNIQIYHLGGTRKCVATFKGHKSWNLSLTWTPDGTRLLSGGVDSSIREWDTSTWKEVGHPWEGHTGSINTIAIHPSGTLVASASEDKYVRLWRLSDRQTIATFQHSFSTKCVMFSVDGGHIFSGGFDKMISEWPVPKGIHPKILAITTARNACIDGDLSNAEELLTQEIFADANDYTSYAHRSFVMARKDDWDNALQDAIKSISIQPSLTGHISKGIALCGKGHVQDARAAFIVAFMFTNQDSKTVHFLILIMAIALFNADQHEEAMLLVKELVDTCPNADTRACHVVEAYLRVQRGINAFDGARHDEAVDHFTAAINSSAFSLRFKLDIHLIYEDLVVLFGWDLDSFWLTTYQKRCQALLSADKVEEALKAHEFMMDTIDETTKDNCLDWSNEFKKQCSALAAHNDRVLGAEIPGQDQDGYDAEPNFFRGMQEHSLRHSRPQPQQHLGHLKRLRRAVTRSPPTAHPPPPAPTTTSPPTSTFKTLVRQLFTRPPDLAKPPVVEVPFAKGRERNIAAQTPGNDPDIVRDEDIELSQPDSNTRQQLVYTEEHGGGKSCFCC